MKAYYKGHVSKKRQNYEENSFVRVGQNTNGAFHFFKCRHFRFASWQIKVMILTQHSEYYDRRFIERIGLTLNIKVPPGDDVYAILKKIKEFNITRKVNRACRKKFRRSTEKSNR